MIRLLVLVPMLTCCTSNAGPVESASEDTEEATAEALVFTAVPDDFLTRPGVSPVLDVRFSTPSGVPADLQLRIEPSVDGVVIEFDAEQGQGNTLPVTLRVKSDAAEGDHTLQLFGTAPGYSDGSADLNLSIQSP